MKKQLKDYAHLYLGCEVICINEDEELSEWEIHKGAIGKLTLVNIGNMQIQSFDDNESWEIGVEFENSHCADWFSNGNFKLLLRSLSDWSIEEQEEYKQIKKDHIPTLGGDQKLYAKYTAHLLSKGFDLFGLIEDGLALDKATITKEKESL